MRGRKKSLKVYKRKNKKIGWKRNLKKWKRIKRMKRGLKNERE